MEDARILSEIGQQIISCLNVGSIISIVYEEVNKLMPATSMNVGIYNSKLNRLDFPGTMEKGEKLAFHWADMTENHKMPVVCYNKELEILVNDMQTEAKLYTGQDPVSLSDDGEIVDALIYIPLYSKKKLLGVISVQSFKKNSYNNYHLQLLKQISTYVGIAIENALLYENMEDEVQRRTEEVVQQKNELEINHRNYTLISEIGKDIISSLSVEEILDKAYDNVNKLMDATAFVIGIYNASMNRLDFPGAIEKGEKLPFAFDDFSKESIASSCFFQGKDIVIDSLSDYYKQKNLERKARRGDNTESLIYMPLKKGDEVIGVISVQSFTERAYSKLHIDMLRTLANYTAIALVNARSYESINTFNEIGKEISSSLDLNSTLYTVYEKVRQLMNAPIFMISSYSEKDEMIHYELCIENDERILEGFSHKVGQVDQSYSSWLIHNKKEIVIGKNTVDYKKYIKTPVTHGGDEPTSLVFIPLKINEKVIGILSVQSLKENAYTDHHVEILRSLASYVSIALNNAFAYKELEEARNEMKRLSIVASETDNAVIIMDNDGNFEWVNKAYQEMSGFDLQGLINSVGKGIRDIEGKGFQKNIDTVFNSKKSVSFESSFNSIEGKKIWVQTNITPVLDERNEISKLVAIDYNITERKEFELAIREKNKDITDSINYASRIQRAMLPSKKMVNELFPNSFILYKPRDIVSGDFYWMTKISENETLVAIVDCTGHGVPGAFLTIVGNNMLNQIVKSNKISDPGRILQEMNKQILEQFDGSTKGGMKDGMDISLCKITKNTATSVVHFAGAYNSIYHISNNKLTEIKADRFAIGTPLENNPTFTTRSFTCVKGDVIYMTSDGYYDQIGGERGKKFKKLNFQNLLTESHHLSIKDQKNHFENVIENWKGKYPQLDDILMMGIEF